MHISPIPREALRQLVAKEDITLWGHPDRLRGALLDMCGEFGPEIFALSLALKQGLLADLRSARREPEQTVIARHCERLRSRFAMASEIAQWAVESWVAAVTGAHPARLQGQQPNRDTALVVSKDGTGDFRSILEAVTTAPTGKRLVVQTGVYEGGFVLDRPLDICAAEGASVSIESSSSVCITADTPVGRISSIIVRSRCWERFHRHPAISIVSGSIIFDNCDISSDSLAGIAVAGPGATPLIHRCVLRNCNQSGVFVSQYARPVIEECEFYGNSRSAIACVRRADPHIRRCDIHDGFHNGIFFSDGATGTVEECSISGNRYAGVAISNGANPLFRRCWITDGESHGIAAWNNTDARISRCEISRNALDGVWADNGRLTIEESKIIANRHRAVSLHAGSKIVIRGSQVIGNEWGPFDIDLSSKLTESDNQTS